MIELNKLKTRLIYVPVNGEPEINTVVHQTGEFIEGVEQQELLTFTPEEFNKYLEKFGYDLMEEIIANIELGDAGNCDENGWGSSITINEGNVLETFNKTFDKYKVNNETSNK